MPARPLPIARNLHHTLLIDIRNPTFAKHYHTGLVTFSHPDTNSIGCLLGNMSLQTFPTTPQEQSAWEAEYPALRERYEQERAD